ncbi:MAG: hypothetical protein FWG65_01640, partial [Turicibacter sp.]|nr:hypothetical protein [Turicibacter sp.]
VQRTRQVRTTYVQYTANGIERTNRLRFPNVIRNFRIGQDLTVFYSPQNPDFIARNPIVDFLVSVITFIGIGIFIAVGGRSVWKTPRE